MKITYALSLLSLTGFAAVVGCSSKDTDNTVLEPSRDARISSLASAACEHYGTTGSGCPGYGTASGQKYATKTDCERDFQAKGSDLWPADKCDSGRINDSAYDACEASAKTYACSEGVDNFFDGIAALDDCKAAKVCTDPAK